MDIKKMYVEEMGNVTLDELLVNASTTIEKDGIILADLKLRDGVIRLTKVPMKYSNIPRDETGRKLLIKKLVDLGFSQSQMSRITGLSQDTIGNIIKSGLR